VKNIIILRSAANAGKTTFANLLCQHVGYVQVCADDYFYDSDGKYNFDPTKLGEAHAQCKRKFLEYLQEPSVKTIVVANTNTKFSEYGWYEECGKKAGAMVFFLVMENRHGNTNSHGVPDYVLDRHDQNIRNDLKLK
jgi:hypothetical protein